MTDRIRAVVADRGSSCCLQCDARWSAANHQAVAVQHHDATGHAVHVHVDQEIRYGTVQVPAGQTSIEVPS